MRVTNVQLQVKFKNATSCLCKQAFGGSDVVLLDSRAEPGSMVTVTGEVWPAIDNDKTGAPRTYKGRDGKERIGLRLIIRPETAIVETADHVAEATTTDDNTDDEPQG